LLDNHHYRKRLPPAGKPDLANVFFGLDGSRFRIDDAHANLIQRLSATQKLELTLRGLIPESNTSL